MSEIERWMSFTNRMGSRVVIDLMSVNAVEAIGSDAVRVMVGGKPLELRDTTIDDVLQPAMRVKRHFQSGQ